MTATPTASVDEIVARRLDMIAAEAAVQQEVIEAAESAQGDEINPYSLQLSTAQRIFFKSSLGAEDNPAIARLLTEHRRTRALRELAGDPAKILAAKAAVDAAAEAERTARANLDDLDSVVGDDGVPFLAKQVLALQERLAKLASVRAAAEAELQSLIAARKSLREAAPELLRIEIDQALAAAKRDHPTWRRLVELNLEVFQTRKAIEYWDFIDKEGRQLIRDVVCVIHAKAFCPEALDGGEYPAAVDKRPYGAHLEKLRNEALPALLAELQELTAQWAEFVRPIEAPLERWVESGEVLR